MPKRKANATPGGANLPAATLGADGRTQRGDGRGRVVDTTFITDGHVRDGALWHGGNAETTQQIAAVSATGTSIFDPVLCELAYRWFCPAGGAILDPFAGGSVRGIVAAYLGYTYTGVDLRPEQIAANEQQAADILGAPRPAPSAVTDPGALTPVERLGSYWAKRDDAFSVNGVRGGKVRTCWQLAQGAAGLVTAGSRASPQVNIVAHVAAALGLPCRVHTPTGQLSPEVRAAQVVGAEVVQHKAGYNNVIIARAREDAAEKGWTNIPFGMECEEAITLTRRQVANLPADCQRIVMPVGSGMSLAAVAWGLHDLGRDLPILGIVVGADPTERLDKYGPDDWRDFVTLQASGTDYHEPAGAGLWHGIALDPHYEAKCLPWLQAGDLLWIVGVRQTIGADGPKRSPGSPAGGPAPTWIVGDSRDLPTIAPGEYDLVFSCPPYFDLEVYSDDPRDLSAMTWPDFLTMYRAIIAHACAMLRPNRFACFVVGDLRDPNGFYRNLPGETIAAFAAAGMALYNDAILVTAVGSLPIRVGKQFGNYRKLGKTHQNVLVFYKGDVKAIKDFGEAPFGGLESANEVSQ